MVARPHSARGLPMAPIGLAVAGLILLTVLPFLADPGRAQVAALVPPWQSGGMVRAASLGLPVVDIRWGGHLLVLDPSGQPAALSRLQEQGFLLLDASRLLLCPPANPDA